MNLPSKWISRKFLVWAAATALLVYSMVLGKDNVTTIMINWWGSISCIYIGGNVASDFITNKKEEIK